MEHRRELRKALAARVRFSWTDPKGVRLETHGMLEDISAGGASLRTRQLLDAGARLEVHWFSKSFSGTVRYCRPSGMDYILGIQKDSVPGS